MQRARFDSRAIEVQNQLSEAANGEDFEQVCVPNVPVLGGGGERRLAGQQALLLSGLRQ